jgi:hypothetical protein
VPLTAHSEAEPRVVDVAPLPPTGTEPRADREGVAVTDPWSARHGDSWQSPPLAVLGADGGTFSLEGWTITAQARRSEVSPEPFHSWADDMITVGPAVVSIPNSDDVTTSSITLHLSPSDFTDMPLRWVGLVECQISNGADTFTVLPARRFEIFPDLVR